MTTQQIKSTRESIWRSSFKLLQDNIKVFAGIALWAFLALAVVNMAGIVLFYIIDSMETPYSAVNGDGRSMAEMFDILDPHGMHAFCNKIIGSFVLLLNGIIALIASYFLLRSGLIASRAPNVPSRSLGGFFRYIGIFIVTEFLVWLPTVLSIGLLHIVNANLHLDDPAVSLLSVLLITITVILAILGIIASIILAFRLLLTRVMVIHGKKGVITKSWHITHGVVE